MTEHAQCGTNPVTLSAGVIRESRKRLLFGLVGE